MSPWNTRTWRVMERRWKQKIMGAGVSLLSTAAPAQYAILWPEPFQMPPNSVWCAAQGMNFSSMSLSWPKSPVAMTTPFFPLNRT